MPVGEFGPFLGLGKCTATNGVLLAAASAVLAAGTAVAVGTQAAV